MATEHPEVFGAVDANAACVRDFEPAGAGRLRLRLDVGEEDTTCGPATQRMHQRFTEMGIIHEYERYVGRRDMETIYAAARFARCWRSSPGLWSQRSKDRSLAEQRATPEISP